MEDLGRAVTELCVTAATRMRARVVEALSLVASEDKQRNYQRAVPDVNVPAELFNQWEDCFFPNDDTFKSAFGPAELEALHQFNDVLDEVCGETPQKLPPLDEFLSSSSWRKLSDGAQAALAALDVNQVPR
jgi:hypothetical protein